MSQHDKYVPYEKWSRAAFKMAYEEADKLRKEQFEELKAARIKVERFDRVVADMNLWASHCIILGRAIDALLQKPK